MTAVADLRALACTPAFSRYTLGMIATQHSYWMFRTISAWQAWTLTNQSFWVGFILAAEMLPSLAVGPWAGVLADRVELKSLLLKCQHAGTLVIVGMTFLSGMGLMSIYALLAFAFANGVVAGFSNPVTHASIVAVVANERLSSAISLHSILFNVSRFIGPAISGLLMSAGSVTIAYSVAALAMIIGCAGIALTEFRPQERLPASPGSLRKDIAAALRHVQTSPVARPIFALFLFAACFLRPIGELVPELADRILGGDASMLAKLSSFMGLGAIVAGFLCMLGGRDGLVRLSIIGAILAILSGLCIAFSTNQVNALIAATAFGGSIAAGGVSAQTILQLSTPSALRGRVMSLFSMVFRAAPALGAVIMGLTADQIGLRWSMGAGCAAMTIAFLLQYPDFRSLTKR